MFSLYYTHMELIKRFSFELYYRVISFRAGNMYFIIATSFSSVATAFQRKMWSLFWIHVIRLEIWDSLQISTSGCLQFLWVGGEKQNCKRIKRGFWVRRFVRDNWSIIEAVGGSIGSPVKRLGNNLTQVPNVEYQIRN